MPGASWNPLPRQAAPTGKGEQNLCSKRELDSQDLTGKEGGPATGSRHFSAEGLISASVMWGTCSQKNHLKNNNVF